MSCGSKEFKGYEQSNESFGGVLMLNMVKQAKRELQKVYYLSSVVTLVLLLFIFVDGPVLLGDVLHCSWNWIVLVCCTGPSVIIGLCIFLYICMRTIQQQVRENWKMQSYDIFAKMVLKRIHYDKFITAELFLALHVHDPDEVTVYWNDNRRATVRLGFTKMEKPLKVTLTGNSYMLKPLLDTIAYMENGGDEDRE